MDKRLNTSEDRIQGITKSENDMKELIGMELGENPWTQNLYNLYECM